jgi:integrase
MAKIVRRTWSSTGPLGRKVTHTSYGYSLMVAGHQERKSSSDWTTEADALEALATRQREIEAGQLDRPRQDRTLGAVVAEYLAHKANEGKRSLADDKIILERKILPAFGADTKLAALSGAAIAQYERRRLGEVKPGTVANELSILRHLLRLAARWGYLKVVPAIILPKRSTGRLRFLDVSEIGRLLGACRESRNPYLLTIVTVALHTGMRQGEIMGLRWERVDLSSARITLEQTKSGQPRGVPINRPLYDALVALEPDPARRTGYLFKAGADRWGKIRTAYELALSRAGIQGATFHTLRHTFASHAVMRGVSLAELRELLGHSTITMTLRYAHLAPTALRAAVERLEGLTDSAHGADCHAASTHESAQSGRLDAAPSRNHAER